MQERVTVVLSLSEKKQVVEPRLHDGSVLGVACHDGQATVDVADALGNRHRLVLSGVERLRAHDFREGNIILDVIVRVCDSDDAAVLKRLFDLGDTRADVAFLAQLLTRAEADQMLLVEVNPSYGCSLTALCRRIELTTP